LPTRNGRHGVAFTRYGEITVRNARHAEDPRPLDETSSCAAARSFSRAYLHHLMKAGEMLGASLLSEINVAYYQELMRSMRAAIAAGRLPDSRAGTEGGWAEGDIPARLIIPTPLPASEPVPRPMIPSGPLPRLRHRRAKCDTPALRGDGFNVLPRARSARPRR